MELNILHTNSYNFENSANMREAARQILEKQGAKKQNTEEILNQTIFNNAGFNTEISKKYSDYQIASWNFFLKSNFKKKFKDIYEYAKENTENDKKHKLGELWKIFSETESTAQETDTDKNCLIDFSIDDNLINIFAA